jgi:DNA-binding SARP family transcriptional activator/DNA-binding beta-propeller fold protein YncE
MEFRLLGPLELEGEQGVVPLGSGKQRTLLAVLLLHANERLSREHLIDELWGDEPPASAAHSLDVYVSRLRKTLQEAAGDGLLTTRGNGYLLRVENGSSDAWRFEHLLDEARTSAPRQARVLLQEALALWRGPALADVELPGSERAAVERLEELRVVASEEQIEAGLALGQHAALVGELQVLVAEHPLRERLRAQHMRALYCAGRQADALDSYSAAQRALDELGLEPSPELKALQRRILNHDSSLRVRGGGGAEEPHRPRRRRIAMIAGLALLVGVAAAVLAVTLTRTSRAAPGDVAAVTNSVGLFDPKHHRLVADIPTGGLSSNIDTGGSPNIAVGLGSVWVCNADDRTVIRIDLATHEVTRTIGLGATPAAIAVGHGFVWVEPQSGDELVKLDSFGNIVQRIPLQRPPRPFSEERGPVSIASGRTAIWAVHGLASVAKVDPQSGRVLRDTIGLGGALPGQILPTANAVWVAALAEGRALRLDPRTATVVSDTGRSVGYSAHWWKLAVGAGGVWVTDTTSDRVWRIHPPTNDVEGSVVVDTYPLGITVRDGTVWVVNFLAGTIDEIDPVAFRVVSRTALGAHPIDIANGPEGLWITFGNLVP